MMFDARREIELKLRGSLLRDWCRQLSELNEDVEFQDAWCSGHRTMRFSTRVVDRLFDYCRISGDCWGLGRAAFYEVTNADEAVSVSLVVSRQGLKGVYLQRVEKLVQLLAQHGFEADESTSQPMALATWVLPEESGVNGNIGQSLDEVWESEVAVFERGLDAWLDGHQRITWRIPESERYVLPAADVADVLYVEGAQVRILTDRFERSKAARRRCLAFHGTACAICGVDFGSLYGEEFAGKIEVHHKKPLSEIREDYEVDPVNDLVPVCPNCHMILHSKFGTEPYTIEEVRSMLKRDA